MQSTHHAWLLSLSALIAAGCEGQLSSALPDLDPGDEPVNLAPFASAGADQSVPEKSLVRLTAVASRDPEEAELRFTWTQTLGISVALEPTDGSTPSFTAPEVPGDQGFIDLQFMVTVEDPQGASASDTTTVRVWDENAIPRAIITDPVRFAQGNDDVLLDGSESYDPDGDIVSYAWIQTAGATVELSGSAAPQVTVTLPDVTKSEVVIIELIVEDDEGRTSRTRATLSVTPTPASFDFLDLTEGTTFEQETTWSPVRVAVLNAAGKRITQSSVASMEVTLELANGSGTLAGTLTQRAAQGLVVFDDLSYDVVEEDVQLRAVSSSFGLEVLSPGLHIVASE